MTIAFCVAADPHTGMGHLVRCRALAEALATRGIQSVMYGPSQEWRTDIDRQRFSDWSERAAWTTSKADAIAFEAFAQHHGARQAVVDDYRADENFQSVIRDAGIDWLQQFDANLPQKFLGRIVVNASPYERAEFYRKVSTHPDVRFLLGPRYAILRKEFDAVVARDPNSRRNRIYMSFGGGDDKGALLGFLTALDPAKRLETRFLVVSGAANPRNAENTHRISAAGWSNVDVLINPPNIPALMLSCDLAILGGGTTTYEAARCGLPMVLVAISDNQIRPCKGWHDVGAAVYVGRWGQVAEDTMQSAYHAVVDDPAKAAYLARRGPELVDSGGTSRLINMMLKGVEQ